MVAVFDIGNTNVHVGLYQERELVYKDVYHTRKELPPAKIIKMIADEKLEGAAIASVVPRRTRQITGILRKHKVKSLVVSSRTESGLKYSYHDPSTLGADRIAALAGALSRYKKNVIVVDAGTATTIDVVRRDGFHIGGIICPGMQILAESIHRRTAQLPKTTVVKPRRLIGKSTEECIQSGVFNGTIVMINGLIQDIRRQVRGDYYCVSTGGAGEIIARYVDEIDEYCEDLCLYGALDIYYRNV